MMSMKRSDDVQHGWWYTTLSSIHLKAPSRMPSPGLQQHKQGIIMFSSCFHLLSRNKDHVSYTTTFLEPTLDSGRIDLAVVCA